MAAKSAQQHLIIISNVSSSVSGLHHRHGVNGGIWLSKYNGINIMASAYIKLSWQYRRAASAMAHQWRQKINDVMAYAWQNKPAYKHVAA